MPTRTFFALLSLLGAFLGASARQGAPGAAGFGQAERALQAAITRHFYDSASGFYREHARPQPDDRPHAYLWPLCALLQAANEVEAAGLDSGVFDPVLDLIGRYRDARSPAPGYAAYLPGEKGSDRYYDDNQWIGLAAMDAWFRTGKARYLHTAEAIYCFMMTGYDTVAGGGLYWKEGDPSTKNTCSNGPGILLALKLYKATGHTGYLDTALLLYHWVNERLRAPSGLYYDNLKTRTGRIGKAQYSYNSGTMLESNVWLFELTGERQYLRQAVAIADSAAAYFLAGDHFRDGYWFNAVLLRAYARLLQVHPDRTYVDRVARAVEAALRERRLDNGLMGEQHAGNLVDQGGMLEMLARLCALERP